MFRYVHAGDGQVRTEGLFGCGVILVNFVNTKGSAVSSFLGGMFTVSIMRVSRVVTRERKVDVSSVFRACNRRCFHSLRAGLLVRVRSHDGIIVSYNNNAPVERYGMMRVGGGNHIILLATGPRAVLSHIGGGRSHPLVRGGGAIPFVTSLVRGHHTGCRTTTSVVVRASNGGRLRVYRRLMRELHAVSRRGWCGVASLICSVEDTKCRIVVLGMSIVVGECKISQLAKRSRVFLCSSVLLDRVD